MSRTRKASKRKNERSLAASKRDLQAQLKSARGAVAQAKQLAIKLSEIEKDVAAAIAPIFKRLQALEARLDEMKEKFSERVKDVAETIAANMAEADRGGRGTETSSGTRKSAFGAVADVGFSGRRLPGSFESNRK